MFIISPFDCNKLACYIHISLFLQLRTQTPKGEKAYRLKLSHAEHTTTTTTKKNAPQKQCNKLTVTLFEWSDNKSLTCCLAAGLPWPRNSSMDTSLVFSRSSSASDSNGDGLGGRSGCVSGGLRESVSGNCIRGMGTGQGSC